jgi:hypothetical protein
LHLGQQPDLLGLTKIAVAAKHVTFNKFINVVHVKPLMHGQAQGLTPVRQVRSLLLAQL